MRIELGVFAVDTIDAGGFEKDFGFQLTRSQSCGRIRGDKRSARAAGQDYNPPLFEMTNASSANVWLGYFVHPNCGLEACLTVQAFQGVLKNQAVEDGGKHSHVVSRGFADYFAPGAELSAADNISAAHHDCQLDAAVEDPLRLPGYTQSLIDTDAAFSGITEPLAAYFEDDTLVLGPSRHT
jgi:hypothetical protein